jgi:flagellar assembly factor FliW
MLVDSPSAHPENASPLDQITSLLVEGGILPFIWARQYAVMRDPDEWPFVWLHSVDQQPLTFVTIPLTLLFPKHAAAVMRDVAPWAAETSPPTHDLLGIVVLRRRPEEISVNLLAPLVVDLQRGTARQVIVDGPIELSRKRIAPALQALSAA